jgi:hypothetical protein
MAAQVARRVSKGHGVAASKLRPCPRVDGPIKKPPANALVCEVAEEAPVRVELTMSDLQSDALATWLRRRVKITLIVSTDKSLNLA